MGQKYSVPSLDFHGTFLLQVDMHLEGVPQHVRLVSSTFLQALVEGTVIVSVIDVVSM